MQSARPKPPSEREPLAGLVERVTFHNADNGFCVLRIKARGHRDLVTVLGAAPSISAGEYIQASGSWENNREHGLQFRAAFLRATAPTSAEGMEKYLGSGLIKGIGPAFAQRLVSAFKETVFEVIGHARKDCSKSKASVPSVRAGSLQAGLTRRSFARSWHSCKATEWAPRGRSASSRLTAPMPSRWSAKTLTG